MSTTIRKIAKDLNIAVSTVSKALRDSHEISEETKRMVLDYARKLDYKPNPYAGSLKNRKTYNIAVVLPEVADTFFSNAINGIESIAQDKGYHVVVYQTHENSDLEASILDQLRGGRVDGVLISVSGDVKMNSVIHAQLAKEKPLIFFDRVCEEIETAKILTDDFEASYQATCHLISRGCKNIIFLSAAGNLSIVDHRRNGFIKALSDNKMEIGSHTIVSCSSQSDSDCRSMLEVALRRENKVDGVLASIEKLAMHTYHVCNANKLSIPSDVKVIAFSNLPIAALLAPPLTTVVQPAFDMGKTAAMLLFKALAKKVVLRNEHIVLPSVIVARDSTSSKAC
ncbi:MAG TPA: LacI family DNA-binding transcriptional regulator [Cyclobacteriaceae bacterium]